MSNIGDRVLAIWPQEVGLLYPGVVVTSSGNAMEVQFDDGGRATLTPDQIKPLNIRVGQRIQCRWKGGPQYFPGVISSQNANAIGIDYDDGDKESTSVSLIRIQLSEL